MTDLHSHILPHLDDGPARSEESAALVEMELDNGVDVIALTPHFNPRRDDPTRFLRERERSLWELNCMLRAQGRDDRVRFITGAEVLLSPSLFRVYERERLCYEGTRTMLVELPAGYRPGKTEALLARLKREGITSLLAHVEKYGDLTRRPEALARLIRAGAILQVNAASLVATDKGSRKRLIGLIARGLVRVVASDTHSLIRRPPLMRQAFSLLYEALPGRTFAALRLNPARILAGGPRCRIEPADLGVWEQLKGFFRKMTDR